MPRIRTLKREFFQSETLAKLPFRTQLTAAGLVCCMADDEGRLRDNPRLIRAEVWSQRDDVTIEDVAEDLMLLNTVEMTSGEPGWIVRYERKGVKCIAIRSWKEHQRISHPTKSKLPPPPRVSRNFAKTPELFGLEVGSGSRKEEVGSGTRARKTRAASNGEGRVPHEDRQPHDPVPFGASDEARALAERAARNAKGAG